MIGKDLSRTDLIVGAVGVAICAPFVVGIAADLWEHPQKYLAFLEDAWQELRGVRDRVGPWTDFARTVAPGAAMLGFLFTSFSSFILLLLSRSAVAPDFQGAGLLFEMLSCLGISLYAAALSGGVVALFGWPALWLFEQLLGPSPRIEAWLIYLLTPNLTTVSVVLGGALVLVIFLASSVIADAQSRRRAAPMPNPSVDRPSPRRNQRRPRSRTSEGFHRIGLAVGGFVATPVLLVGLFNAISERSLLTLLGTVVTATVLVLIPYGIFRLLGWVADGFVSGGKST